MRRVRHSVVAFSTIAAAIMSVSAADLCARPAQAEDWPTRPLTLVVRGNLLLRPVELGSVDPYAVQNYRELARDGNCGLSLLLVET